MKKIKFTAVLLAIATMAISVTGCGTKFDAKAYVQGNLDAVYKNEITDDFAKVTAGGREEIQKMYDDNIKDMVDYYQRQGCPEDLLEDYKTASQDLFKCYKYSVGEPVKGEDNSYVVPVEVSPLVMDFETMLTNVMVAVAEWQTEHADASEQEQLEQYYVIMLDELKAMSANPTYTV